MSCSMKNYLRHQPCGCCSGVAVPALRELMSFSFLHGLALLPLKGVKTVFNKHQRVEVADGRPRENCDAVVRARLSPSDVRMGGRDSVYRNWCYRTGRVE